MPARAPPSIDMLQTVMRPSIDSASIAAPPYSMTWPVPPAVPISPMMARMMSLAVTPSGSAPSTATRMFLAFVWISVWVASTCSTSEVPMPWASAPKAPWVEVWLSPQTIVVPGQGEALLGPDDVDDALAAVELVVIFDAELARVLGERLDLLRGSRDRRCRRCGRWSGCCGRRRRASSPARAPCGRSCAGPRTPAGSSPRGRDGGRCR